jgi:hypothetical protein
MGQKLLKSNLFAFYLTTKNQEKFGMSSDLTFGYYDKEKFKGNIDWHPVQFKYMFGVQLDDVKVNGKRQNICVSQKEKCLITFDSGTTLMSFPTWAVVKFSEKKIPTSNVVQLCESSK